MQRALWWGASIADVFSACKIDPWFLNQIAELNEAARVIAIPGELTDELLRNAKQLGFSYKQIADLRGLSEADVRAARANFNVHAVYKTVDTCAA